MHRDLHKASPMHIPNPGPGEQVEVSGQSLSVSVLSGSGRRDGSGLTEPCLGGGICALLVIPGDKSGPRRAQLMSSMWAHVMAVRDEAGCQVASARHRWPCVDGLSPRCAINTWFLRAPVIFHYYLSASWAPVDTVSQRVAYPKHPPH